MAENKETLSNGSISLGGYDYDFDLTDRGWTVYNGDGDQLFSVGGIGVGPEVVDILREMLFIHLEAYSRGLVHGENKAFGDLRRLIRAENAGAADDVLAKVRYER